VSDVLPKQPQSFQRPSLKRNPSLNPRQLIRGQNALKNVPKGTPDDAKKLKGQVQNVAIVNPVYPPAKRSKIDDTPLLEPPLAFPSTKLLNYEADQPHKFKKPINLQNQLTALQDTKVQKQVLQTTNSPNSIPLYVTSSIIRSRRRKTYPYAKYTKARLTRKRRKFKIVL